MTSVTNSFVPVGVEPEGQAGVESAKTRVVVVRLEGQGDEDEKERDDVLHEVRAWPSHDRVFIGQNDKVS